MLVKSTRRRKLKRRPLHHRGSIVRRRTSGGWAPKPITERDVEGVSAEARAAMGRGRS